jgi:Mlc titration factor MtfA (ptsG expression regulator)
VKWLERLRLSWVLRKHALPDHVWFEVTRKLPLLATLNSSEKARLRLLTTLFIDQKAFSGAQGFEVTLEVKIIIAAQACLEILAFNMTAFEGWSEIIIYPTAFRVERETRNELGLVSKERRALSGEAWQKGPLILAWDEVERDSLQLRAGHHVVLHEFAHKLDMLNGRANGMPPLHPDMAVEAWTASLSEAYERLVSRVEHHRGAINPYAATNPAEFFAVMCEYFFTAPELLFERYPAVYEQLKAYFRQDPLARV